MADLSRTSLASAPPAPAAPAADLAPSPPSPRHRPRTPARRAVLRELRDQVDSGAYEPPVDALSAELAAWLLGDGLPDRARP